MRRGKEGQTLNKGRRLCETVSQGAYLLVSCLRPRKFPGHISSIEVIRLGLQMARSKKR